MVSSGILGSSTAPTPPPVTPPEPVWRLVVAYAPVPEAIGTSRWLGLVGREPIVVGRAGTWPLADPQASREHARVSIRADGAAIVEDLGSRNGTFVGGARISRAVPLEAGAVVRIGSHVLVLDLLPGATVGATIDPAIRSRAILGEHPTIRALITRAAKIAPLAEPVLVLGESGTGKELFAEHIHASSGRRGPLVAVNCAALPEALAESELFGHARGAYTGAASAREGLFAAASGGTLFLDEIGDAPASLQPKLLRALESGEVRAVGESRARRVDVRVVAATNVDLETAVERGSFRADLLARLAAHVLRLPPLRDRRTDVLALAARFLAPADRAPPAISAAVTPDAAEALLAHDYARNVRELQQILRHARAESQGALPIALSHLPAALAAPLSGRAAPAAAVSAPDLRAAELLAIRRDSVPEAAELRTVLAHYEGNVSRVAEFFGKDRKQIYRWAERLGVPLSRAPSE